MRCRHAPELPQPASHQHYRRQLLVPSALGAKIARRHQTRGSHSHDLGAHDAGRAGGAGGTAALSPGSDRVPGLADRKVNSVIATALEADTVKLGGTDLQTRTHNHRSTRVFGKLARTNKFSDLHGKHG